MSVGVIRRLFQAAGGKTNADFHFSHIFSTESRRRMNTIVESVKRYLGVLFSTRAAAVYMLAFAIVIAIATFVENDFGTSSSQKLIYKSGWFTGLLTLFGICIIVNIFRFRLVQQKKWALLMFHAAMIVILLGAAVSRYFGYEGIMHIREGQTSNTFLSSDTYLQFKVYGGGQTYEFDEPVLFATLGDNDWEESYLVGNDLIEVKVKEFIPNPAQVLSTSPAGRPIVKVVFGGAGGREEYFIHKGETREIHDVLFNFNNESVPDAINLAYRNDSMLLMTNRPLLQTVMATQERDTLYPGTNYHPLRLRAMYSDGAHSFVFGDFNPHGVLRIESENPKMTGESMAALKMEIAINGQTDSLLVVGAKGVHGRPAVTKMNNVDLAVTYGSKHITLPFSLTLRDFIMERYPGTNSAASYASEVELIDSRRNLEESHSIYMNHILSYDGFRFFQSSFDNDEMGTYLSVNHDFWGTWISYTGYALLTVGMLMSLLSRKSRFYEISQRITRMRGKDSVVSVSVLTLVLASVGSSSAQKVIDQRKALNVVDAAHAAAFSELIVQDYQGRMKPVHTLSREVMRKLSRRENIEGLDADQCVLGMFVFPDEWIGVPMISIGKNEEVRKLLDVRGSMASYRDFFDQQGAYLLTDEVRSAYALQPADRGVFEKELMKIDERVNIANMVFSGSLFRMVPIPGDPNHTWAASQIPGHTHDPHDHADTSVAEDFFASYKSALREAAVSKDYTMPNEMIRELATYQRENGKAVIPSPSALKGEIFLNRLKPFSRLALVYTVLGVSFLFLLFYAVFRPEAKLSLVTKVLFVAVVLAFVWHTAGLGLRWYVSGRAPWSNGYESMIYIAWTTSLAGLIFSRRSYGGYAATMILAATLLLVAMLSDLDPEITPLVPVLRSYWLTIHVSLEAGSYGFLMLGAIIGLINLILMMFITKDNEAKIHHQIREMSYLSEMTLIGGLFMISIGTYLGGVWANESWGRYWGWDAKETWALVTILVYAFILHMRLIPKLQGLYAYNFASIFGLASVVMTYYGVNYYLSGLHSYAAGDPVPIPTWVYLVVGSIMIISMMAFWKNRTYKLTT